MKESLRNLSAAQASLIAPHSTLTAEQIQPHAAAATDHPPPMPGASGSLQLDMRIGARPQWYAPGAVLDAGQRAAMHGIGRGIDPITFSDSRRMDSGRLITPCPTVFESDHAYQSGHSGSEKADPRRLQAFQGFGFNAEAERYRDG